MDRVVGILVRLLSACGACARVLPGIDYAQWRPGETLKILLAGYNGARNTGSDVRMAALVSQLRALFGDTVELSLMSDPWTVRPIPCKTSARGAMETPPMPMR